MADIPTKASVTNIVNKNFDKQKYSLDLAQAKDTQNEEDTETYEFPKPKFLSGTEKEIITPQTVF